MSNVAYVQSILTDHFTEISSDLSQDDVAEQMADIVVQLFTNKTITVSVVGGAASGKTTIAEELVEHLKDTGLSAEILSTDNYVVGDRDFRQITLKKADAQKKYDFVLMDTHIAAIRELGSGDKPVAIPELDAGSGIAVDEPDNYTGKIGPTDILVIEGDFPRDDYDLRFYIQVPDKQRLENNMQREVDQQDDVDTGVVTQRFNDRQRTIHKPYTLPALQSADYVLVADIEPDDWVYSLQQRDH